MPRGHNTIEYPPVGIREVFHSFWVSMKPHKLLMLIILGGYLFSKAFDVVIPLYYKRFFDTLQDATPESANSELLSIIFFIGLLNFCAWGGRRIANFANVPFQTKVIADLKQRSFKYLLHHSYNFFANNFTGSIVQRINRYGRAFERIADRFVYDIYPLMLEIIGFTTVLWFQKPEAAYIMILWFLLLLTFNLFYQRWKLPYDIAVAEEDSRTTAVLADALTNHNSIQLFAGAEAEAKNYDEETERQAKITAKAWRLNNVSDMVQGLLIILFEFLLFAASIYFWQTGVISIGFFVLIQVYLLTLSRRMWDLSRVIREIYQGYADAKELIEMVKLPYDIKDAPNAVPLAITDGGISFRDVSFNFNKTKEVLSDINLQITPREKVALIGPSGAGKTTLVRLLIRLYDVTRGSIEIDGHNIQKVTENSLREQISFVPQDPILFHRTLLENIRYGQRDAADEEVIAAGRLAHCDDFVGRLPAGYGTYVGERGVKLSGGERQRVAIARAILKNAPILILDEATSSLDSHSEALIQDALLTLMKGKTVIVIAHRLSTIRSMNRIIVLKEGRIIEEGSHEDLLKNEESLYKKLWSLQAGGFIPDQF